jgi:glycosyltransferase involved in cell wall biosynthesis
LGRMDIGGAETMLMNLFRRLNRSELVFDFAVNCSGPGFYDAEIQALGGRVLQTGHPKEVGLTRWYRTFAQILRDAGPFCAVHSHVYGFSGLVLGIAKRAGVTRRIAHSHTVQHMERQSIHRRLYMQVMRRYIATSATDLLGCSRAACEALFGPDCWRDSRVRTWPNAIDTDRFNVSEEDRRRCRARLGIDDDTCVVGHIGRFTAPKNHLRMLDVFDAFQRRRRSGRLVLVGDGITQPQVREAAASRGLNVTFLGNRVDIPNLLSAFDVVLFPSTREGLPLTMIEAQASGVPCVVSDVVPREVDLSLGLIRFVSLESSDEDWAASLDAILLAQRPGWPTRQHAVTSAGYDLSTSIGAMASLYGLTQSGIDHISTMTARL